MARRTKSFEAGVVLAKGVNECDGNSFLMTSIVLRAPEGTFN